MSTVIVVTLAALAFQAQEAPPPAPEVEGPPAGPEVMVLTRVHDFGSYWAVDEKTHTFEIGNTGDAPLRVLQVKPACGCTATEAYPEVIAPGETGEFTFVLHGAAMRGPFEKHIRVVTDDPVTPVVTLTLKGDVKPRFSIEPATLSFPHANRNVRETSTTTIHNLMDEAVKLELEANRDGPFVATLETVKPGRLFELEVTTVPPLPEGWSLGNFNIKTGLPDARRASTMSLPPPHESPARYCPQDDSYRAEDG